MVDTTRSESQAWELVAARSALSTNAADGYARRRPPESPVSSGKSLVDFFARNGFPLLGLPDSFPLFRDLELSRARDEEAAEYGRLRAEFEIVRQAWESERIDCLALKSAGTPPDFPYKSGNLDVLVPSDGGAEARRLLGQLGYVELRNCEEPNKFLFRRFRDGSAACDIHLHLRIEWRVSFLFEDQVWDRRRRSTDEPRLFIPSPEDALLINLAHSFFENKSFDLWDLKKVEHCLSSPGLEWDYIWRVADAKGWRVGLASALLVHDRLVSLLMGQSAVPQGQIDCARRQLGKISGRRLRRLFSRPYSLPFPIGFAFSKRLFVQKILTDRSEGLPDRIRDLFLHFTTGTKLKLGLRSQPGFLIALSGVDGAGKTTQARSLSRALDRCSIRTKYVWSRPGSSRLSSQLVKLAAVFIPGLRYSATGAPGRDQTDPSRDGKHRSGFSPNNWLHRAAWLCLVLLDCLMVFGVRVRLGLLTGHVVICDRYLPDAFADLANRFKNEKAASHPLIRLVAAVCPRPDFAVLLRLDPEQARSRQEPDSRPPTTESDRSQARLLETFAQRNRVIVLDASRDAELVSDELVFRSLTSYFSRFWTLINMVFFANPRSAPDPSGLAWTLPDRPAPMTYDGRRGEERA
jgi:thymidylate kinase